MATTKTPTKPAAPKVTLPSSFEVETTDEGFTREGGFQSKPNPLAEQVATANTNRDKSYVVKGITSEAMATKVTNLLRSAGNRLGVSVRVQYKPDAQVVQFAVRDKITRERKPKVS